jgi:putative ABC transport system permease protein
MTAGWRAMNGSDVLAMSWGNLGRRKVRTLLTGAGVFVGVTALVLMVSLALGLEREILRVYQTDEAQKTLKVQRLQKGDGAGSASPFNFMAMGAQMVPITDKDLEEMAAIPGVTLAAPDIRMIMRSSSDDAGSAAVLVGGVATAEEPFFRGLLVAGLLWSGPEARECIIPVGFTAKTDPKDFVGRTLKLEPFIRRTEAEEGPSEYRVVGVYNPESVIYRGTQVLVPMAEAKALRDRTQSGFGPFAYTKGGYLAADVRIADPRSVNDVGRHLTGLGYSVTSASSIIKQINVIFLVVEAFMACIGGIGLVVALFGIANTMAMAVLERTREIGIMKALGARNRDIGRVFLAEAAAIGAMGGLAGLTAAFLLGKLMNVIARGAYDLPERAGLFHVSPWLAVGSVLFSTIVSLLAGWLPARRAARLDPVASLRYE